MPRCALMMVSLNAFYPYWCLYVPHLLTAHHLWYPLHSLRLRPDDVHPCHGLHRSCPVTLCRNLNLRAAPSSHQPNSAFRQLSANPCARPSLVGRCRHRCVAANRVAGSSRSHSIGAVVCFRSHKPDTPTYPSTHNHTKGKRKER